MMVSKLIIVWLDLDCSWMLLSMLLPSQRMATDWLTRISFLRFMVSPFFLLYNLFLWYNLYCMSLPGISCNVDSCYSNRGLRVTSKFSEARRPHWYFCKSRLDYRPTGELRLHCFKKIVVI